MSKQTIIENILTNSRVAAQNLIDDSNKKAQSEKEKVKSQLEELMTKQKAVVDEQAQEIIARRATVSKLDAAKHVLAVKQSLIDLVFESAAEKLKLLKNDEYIALIKKMLAGFAADGDTVVVSKNDAKRIDSAIVQEVASKRKIKLQLSKDYGDFKGGFLLTNPKFDKTLTLESIVWSERADLESEVAGILFKENKTN